MLLIAITAVVQVFAQSGFEAIKAREEAGDVLPQFILGAMYDLGDVVAQNDQEAVKWYRLAADQGYADAQNNLGVMYGLGQGVPQNDQRVYVWFLLAATQDNTNAIEGRDLASKVLSQQALDRAQAHATRYLESNLKDCD